MRLVSACARNVTRATVSLVVCVFEPPHKYVVGRFVFAALIRSLLVTLSESGIVCCMRRLYARYVFARKFELSL